MNPYDIAPILKRIINVTNRVSDIIFSPGYPPKVIIDGQLQEIPLKDLRTLTPYQTEVLGLAMLKDKPTAFQNFLKTGSGDTSYSLEQVGRFRVNIFRQRNSLAAVMRVIPTVIPTFDSLGLPKELARTVDLKNGIVLITGPTGSGKTSTLAATLNLMSQKYAYHIITIEDPIEFLYPRNKSIIHQRELGSDTDDFKHALKTALRQAPQVIMVGEMRDKESIEIALEAAETGHLILSTLHTIDAAKTMERIIGVFPKEQEALIRARFSQTFRYIVSQRLVPRRDGRGRVAVVEILKSSERTRSYIVKGMSDSGGTLTDAMEDGGNEGMQTFDGELQRLVRERVVSKDTALQYSTNPNNLALKLGMLKEKSKGDDPDVDASGTFDDLPILGLDHG